MSDFHEVSYRVQSKKENVSGFDVRLKNKDSVDWWRHQRMLNTILPLVQYYPNSTWLSIGDGRYGSDAHFLLQHDLNCIASDITDKTLKLAQKAGFIENYIVENAENMHSKNRSYDFVLCKEAYHHLPRPMVGLYEMLRVARKGVILIEPNDHNIFTPRDFTTNRLLFFNIQHLKQKIKSLFGKSNNYRFGQYEKAGNFTYTISIREIEKVALGMNYPLIAYKGFNDAYFAGVEEESLHEKGPLFKKVKDTIGYLDRLVARGKKNFGLLTVIIFKEEVDESLTKSMEMNGFSLIKLSRNPFISAN